ncbi:MAG: VWA domain-containing protein, partial [Planctomycetaceae bacterium]
MEFLHLGLLPYFLPLAAIPIVLHLLTLHRLKTVELSTFRFLFDSYVQQRRRMKFLEALIALLRTLFLLFLVLSVARPVVKHWDSLFGGSGGGRDVVLLFDTSASMATTSDGVSSIRRAKQTASEIVDRLSADDRVTILQVASKPKEICNRFSSDSEAIQSEIQSLDVVPSRANLFAAFSHLFGSSAAKLTNPLIYVFTDMQSSGWSEFSDGQSSDLVPEGTELIVVNVGSNQEVSNQAIVGGAPAVQHAIVGLPITLRPQVANYSVSGSAEVSVSVFIDEKEIARTNLALKPGETGEAEIVYTPNEPGVLRGRYEIVADHFTDDDTYLFSIDVAPQLEVLLINGHPTPEPLDNEGLYLRTAMTATDADPTETTNADAP